jgi:hypothetical protein
MSRFSRPAARRLSALVLLALYSSGCMSWRSEPVSPAQLIAGQKPDVVRITRTDSSRVVIRSPSVQGDTLYGQLDSAQSGNPAARVGIPLAEVGEIATRRSDPTKTTLLGVGIAVGAFSLLCLGADALGCGEEPTFLAQADFAR